MVPFFVSTLVSNFESINSQEYDLCKTLRMNNWQTWYEVIIIGRIDQVVESMRQNFAITWLMITMIEGLSMSEGGLGVMLIKTNRPINLSKAFALLIIIFIVGMIFDYVLGKIRTWFFPYTNLQVLK
jgi:NitT/TauT family transport system permease protein